jgi:hypothetical protein
MKRIGSRSMSTIEQFTIHIKDQLTKFIQDKVKKHREEREFSWIKKNLTNEECAKIVKVEFAFNNGSVQELLKERGGALKKLLFETNQKSCFQKCLSKICCCAFGRQMVGCRATEEIENDINTMMKDDDKMNKITSPTLCFVTFENHEA